MRVVFSKSDVKDKKMKAVFYDDKTKIKTTHFGYDKGKSFIDHKDDSKKEAWIARHKVRGSFQEPMSASALAKHILWNKPSIQNSIKDYKNKFKLK